MSAADPSPAATDAAFASGLLWKITPARGDPSYLFGTIHLEDARVLDLPPPVAQALAHTASLTIEVVMHPRAQAIYAHGARLRPPARLSELLGTTLYAGLADIAARDYALPETELDALKPWAVFTLLSRPAPRTGVTLDVALVQAARAAGKPVHGLESAAELVAALDGIALANQIEILRDAVCNYARLPSQRERMLELYLQRDAGAMLALNVPAAHQDVEVFRDLIERLVHARNQRMVERMRARLAEGNAFFAVGALHLPGAQGLLQLLSEGGYDITRVY